MTRVLSTLYFLLFILSCSSGTHPSFLKKHYDHDALLDADIPPINLQSKQFLESKEKLEAWLKRNIKKKYYYSVKTGIVVGNKLVYNFHSNSKKNDTYGLASVTKIFTSLSIMQLLEKGKLKLDDPITKYFPYLHIEKAILKSKPVSIRNLLNHTSGIPDVRYYKKPKWIKPATSGLGFSIPQQVYPAGVHYRYSNYGFMILGSLIAKLSGMSLRDYYQKKILNPLKMKDTKLSKKLAGAYGIRTSLGDLAKFVSMWLNKGETPDGEELIDEDSIILMTESPLNYPAVNSFLYVGLGWRIRRDKKGVLTMFHIGGSSYMMSWIQLFPRQKTAILYLGDPPEITDKVIMSIMTLQDKLAKLASIIVGQKRAINSFKFDLAKKESFPGMTGFYFDPLHKKKLRISFEKYKKSKEKQLYLFRKKWNKEKRYILQSLSARQFISKKEYVKYDFNFNKQGKVEGVSTVNGYYFKVK